MAHTALREIQFFRDGRRIIVKKGDTFDFDDKEARRLMAKGAVREIPRTPEAAREEAETE